MSQNETNPSNVLELADEVASRRETDHAVTPLFLNRWSPRSFADTPVAEETLLTVLEAGRWSPSSNNLQPWRFIVAKTPEQLELFQSFIVPGNRAWTDRAPVLLLLASNPLRDNGEPNGSHAFDTGAAWASIALQAQALGLIAHAVGGFDRAKAKETLELPDGLELHAVVALGYRGGLETLDPKFHEREVPSGRRPLQESLIEAKAKG
ncbi:nitroreductase family protein [Paenibacillus xanthanilyticus]|uniref:Nitroreductase family protein n=1 Tax=Paenibacillus xanthanilyticus TaxID=1783531 RepID=A0ABV8K1M1_9BACL